MLNEITDIKNMTTAIIVISIVLLSLKTALSVTSTKSKDSKLVSLEFRKKWMATVFHAKNKFFSTLGNLIVWLASKVYTTFAKLMTKTSKSSGQNISKENGKEEQTDTGSDATEKKPTSQDQTTSS